MQEPLHVESGEKYKVSESKKKMPKIRSKKTSISISISMLPINAAMTGSALWQGLVGSGRWKFAAGVFISSYKPPPPPPPTTATGGRVPQKEGG